MHNPQSIVLVIASKNLHKVREFRAMLNQFESFDVLSLLNFSDYIPPEETGETFMENALIKAEHAAKTLQELVLADDSGLVVPAIGGKPGVHSRRFAGDDATDRENRKKLLSEMQNLSEVDRCAYFECSLALASPEGVVKSVTGKSEGRIAIEEKGRHGFGYDPLFFKEEYSKTFAELEEATKNRVSHRRKAFDKLASTLERIQSETGVSSR